MKSFFTRLIKNFFRFRYPVSLIEPAYFWLQGPKLFKWILAFRPISLFFFEIPFLRNLFFRMAVNERIVENSFALSCLSLFPAAILDVGATSSWLSFQLASLGHQAWAIDLRPYEFSHPNLRFIQNDIFQVDLPKNYFDFILIISALEHIGLNEKVYGQEADIRAVDILIKFLKKGGKMILTVPYGQPRILSSHRVYSGERIRKLIGPNLVIKKESYFKKVSPTVWIQCSEKEAAEMDSSKISNGLVCFLLEKI